MSARRPWARDPHRSWRPMAIAGRDVAAAMTSVSGIPTASSLDIAVGRSKPGPEHAQLMQVARDHIRNEVLGRQRLRDREREPSGAMTNVEQDATGLGIANTGKNLASVVDQ